MEEEGSREARRRRMPGERKRSPPALKAGSDRKVVVDGLGHH